MSRLQYAARSVTRMVPLVPIVLSSQKVPMSRVSSDRRCRISRPILISACMTDSTDLAREPAEASAVTCMNQPYNYMLAASNWYGTPSWVVTSVATLVPASGARAPLVLRADDHPVGTAYTHTLSLVG